MKFLCLLIALTLSAGAAETGPGDAALKFLEAVRSKSINLEPGQGTAISPHTSANKVKTIAGRLERMVMDIGQRPLQVGRVKTDGDLAGVLVWIEEGHDLSLVQVFPVAMVRRDNQWLPAPVPASFENCNIGYNRETRERVAALENWMLRQQALDLIDLRTRAVTRIREKISTGIQRSTIDTLKPGQAIERFLEACRHGREYELLGLMGGLQDQLPEQWVLLATSLEAAIHRPDPPSPWRLLMADDVLRVRVYEEADDDQALVTLACIDPRTAPLEMNSGLPQIQIVYIEALRNLSGELRVQPPPFIWNPSADTRGIADPDLDKDLLDQFSRQLRRMITPSFSENEQAAVERLTKTLQQGAYAELLPMIAFGSDAERTRMAAIRAADVWGRIHGLATAERDRASQWPVPLDLTTAGDKAAASFQMFSTRKPDRFEIEVHYFTKSADGWLWDPAPDQATTDEFKDWRRLQRDQWRDQWRARLLAGCPVIDKLPADGAPSEAECRELTVSWLQALQSGDIGAALRHCALLGTDDSSIMMLRNLGYDLAANNRKQARAIRGFHSDRGWAAVGLDTVSGEKEMYPFYAIVATDSGPRILLEADLIASSARSRVFLNDTTLNRLKKIDADAAAALGKLFEQHREACFDQN